MGYREKHRGINRPAVQSFKLGHAHSPTHVHVDEPRTSLYCPTGHDEHWVSILAPGVAPMVPRGQGLRMEGKSAREQAQRSS